MEIIVDIFCSSLKININIRNTDCLTNCYNSQAVCKYKWNTIEYFFHTQKK